MIRNMDQMITIAKQIPDFEGRVFREFPQVFPEAPFVVISAVSGVADLVIGGEEIISSMTYSVDVYADTPDDAEDLLSELNDLYTEYNIIRIGGSSGFDSNCALYRANISLRATLDKRGGSYHN